MFLYWNSVHLEVKLQNKVASDISKGYKSTTKLWVMYLEG